MKSMTMAVALTALFTHLALESVHMVVVRTEQIVKETKRGKQIQEDVMKQQTKITAPFKEIEEKLRKLEADLVAEQAALTKEEEAFKTQAALLSPEARNDKYEELQKKRRNLDEKVADFQKAMRNAHEDAKKADQKLEQFYRKEMMGFEEEIKNLIEDVAKSENWDIVLAKETLIYASSAVDKTSIIVKKLDEKEEKRQAAAKAAKAVSK